MAVAVEFRHCRACSGRRQWLELRRVALATDDGPAGDELDGLKSSAIRLYLAGHLEATKQKFDPESLCNTANLSIRTAQTTIVQLEEFGLMKLKGERLSLSYTESKRLSGESLRQLLGTDQNRPVPIPREFIKTLSRVSTGSHIVVALAHFMRCLFIDRGSVNTTGFVKASFITKLTGICERTIHAARSWLRRKGFIKDKEVEAKVSRRWGGCFSVILPQKSLKKPSVNNSKYAGFAPLLSFTPRQ